MGRSSFDRNVVWRGDVAAEVAAWARECAADVWPFPCGADPIVAFLEEGTLMERGHWSLFETPDRMAASGSAVRAAFWAADAAHRAANPWGMNDYPNHAANEAAWAKALRKVGEGSRWKPEAQRARAAFFEEYAAKLRARLLPLALTREELDLWNSPTPGARGVALDLMALRAQPASQVAKQPLTDETPS